MSTENDNTPREQRTIETASGTTSPDNAKSGKGAYIIAGIAVLVCLALGSCVSGCMNVFSMALDEVMSEEPDPFDIDPYEKDLEDYDLFPFTFDDDEGSQGDGGYSSGDVGGTVEVKQVLGGDLSAYSVTIDSLLFASDYANAESSVRTSVREIVLADRNASSELANMLHSAAWGDKDLSEALAQASELAAQTTETIRATSLPTVEGGNAAEISRGLEKGKSAAVERWTAISAELELLSQGDEVSYSDLAQADDAVAQAAEDAASEFSGALGNSAKRQ